MKAGSVKPMEVKLRKYTLCPVKGCWLWTGAKDRDGYGRMRGSSQGEIWFKFAHRASYEFHVGSIPEGGQVLHGCDVPSCINPEHLYLGDPAQNGLDKKLRGRARTTPQCGPANGMFGRVGPLNPMYGKHHTQETRDRISAAKKQNRSCR
jgi:hypothetical protein